MIPTKCTAYGYLRTAPIHLTSTCYLKFQVLLHPVSLAVHHLLRLLVIIPAFVLDRSKFLAVLSFNEGMKVLVSILVLLMAEKNPMAAKLGTLVEECGLDQFFEDGICKNCAPCNLYNRLPPRELGGCGKTVEECGPCMSGFQAEEWTEGRYSQVCVRIDTPTLRVESLIPSDPAGEHPRNLEIALLVVLVAVLAAGSFMGVRYFRKRFHTSETRRADEEAAKMLSEAPPPPYDSQVATAPPLNPHMVDYVGGTPDRVVVPQLENELVSEAVPIRNYFDDEDNSEENADIFFRARDPDAVSFSSDETIPSMWEPTDDQTPQNARPRPAEEALRDSPPPSPDPGLRRDNSPTRLRRSNSAPHLQSGSSSLPGVSLGQCCSVPLRSPGDRASRSWPSLHAGLTQNFSSLIGIYEGVHVRLSETRQWLNTTRSVSLPQSPSPRVAAQSSCTTPGGRNFSDEGEEPGPPRSFSFHDLPIDGTIDNNSTLVPSNGSYDSGFEDANRRRPFDVEEFEILLYLSAKRPRRD